jgi:CRISP-associated protein Cas1
VRRVLDLSGGVPGGPQVFRLRLHQGCLLVAHGTEDEVEEVRIPVHEIAVLVLGPRTVATGALLGAITANGGAAVVLDDRFRPSGLLCPYAAHSQHAERLRLQVERLPARAPHLWAKLVHAKLRAQSALVPEEERLADLASGTVPDGDPSNLEAQGARLYWPALMGQGFRRTPGEGDDHVNALLDYGYAVLRAAVARALAAAGLHPALGIHHRGARNAFALADDVMEPLRPLVDRAVARHDVPDAGLDRACKGAAAGVVLERVDYDGQRVGLLEACEGVAAGLVRTIVDGGDWPLPEMVS